MPETFESAIPMILKLTRKEIQVFFLLSKAYRNKEIARSLDVSLRTVEFHRSNLRNKLSIRDTKSAIEFAEFLKQHNLDLNSTQLNSTTKQNNRQYPTCIAGFPQYPNLKIAGMFYLGISEFELKKVPQ